MWSLGIRESRFLAYCALIDGMEALREFLPLMEEREDAEETILGVLEGFMEQNLFFLSNAATAAATEE